MSDDFRQKFKTFSERMVGLAPRCSNEEATKMFLVLPFLQFLGYDTMNPDEVCPEHHADFSDKYKNRVDYAVLKDRHPVIAIECKALGAALKDDRGQLKSYFNAAQTVKMGVITDGLVYEFYADSDEPNIMDPTAFLSFDLREIAKGKIEDSIVDGLKSLQKSNFDPENIGAEAKRKLVFQNLVQQIEILAADPSEAFVRLLLQNIGLKHTRAKAMAEYTDLTKNAFGEFINLRILQRLDLPVKDKEAEKNITVPEISKLEPESKPVDVVAVSELEMYVYEYTKRRLSFLSDTDDLFNAIDEIEYKDYKGKFVVFYKKERAGRLFDFHEDKGSKYAFDFGEDFGGEVSGDDLAAIDAHLLSVFRARVEAMGVKGKKAKVEA
ncbi:type I restriction enzyme HsdR N-terminal domain-containing protein [Acetobacter sp. TBRC 12305]|uniref:Type I restriction enzyme HsdR N-terminal domain-containing protein n=1 Tax=Acetobacter garciniae TaxID=2817435 RepID=A0A939KRL1_9PROT|nr:type I restriction endonuclease [Acetobacter garciniae]MBO1325331.1 type I restriction enzyme HsdR N-terminal domain-containing protein [Acetobacter garciniae]MBX0345497.1 type I restriction enzyme HsdR N-terminal domain-containing protein [Acetobacter garciniae]